MKNRITKHLEQRHKNSDSSNIVNTGVKLELNFDDFRIPPQKHDPLVMFQVVEAGMDSTTAMVPLQEQVQPTVISPDSLTGLAELAAASEAAAAAQEEQITEIIVQTIGPNGHTSEEQHINISGLIAGVTTEPPEQYTENKTESGEVAESVLIIQEAPTEA